MKYYTVHISQDGFLSTEKNFVSVKNILRKTIEYFIQKRTNAYILIENLEYPKYPSTPQELFWWFNKVKEYAGNSGLKIGVVIDVATRKTRGDYVKREESSGMDYGGKRHNFTAIQTLAELYAQNKIGFIRL